MMQVPPPPPGFEIIGQGGTPPPPPGFQLQPPMQRQTQQRPAQRQQAAASSQVSPDTGINDLGGAITGDDTPEQMAAKLRAVGMPDSEIAGYVRDYQSGLNAQNLQVGQSYRDPRTGEMRTVGAILNPGDPGYKPPQGQKDTYEVSSGLAFRDTPGYAEARRQEEEKRASIPGYGQESLATITTAPFNDEFHYLAGLGTQGAANFIRSLRGEENTVGMFDRARAMADLSNEEKDRFAKERPLQNFIGQVAGGFAFSPARAIGLLNFARPTMAQGYGQAAGIGATYGAAEAQGGVGSRAAGGLFGGAAGVATAGALDGLIGAGTNAVNRVTNPSALSAQEQRVASIMDRVMRDDKIADPLATLHALPQGARSLDIETPYMQGLVELAAQTPGPARQAIRQGATERQAAGSQRFRDAIQNDLGGEGNYFATLDNSISQRRTAAEQGIKAIEQSPVRLSPDAVTSLRSDLAQQEVRRIAQLSLGSPDPIMRENGANLNRLADVLLDNPGAGQMDLRSAQELSKQLLKASDDAWRGGDGFRGQILGDIGRSVRNSAGDTVPAYRQWLKQYGEDSDNIAALERGRSVLGNLNDARPDGISAEVLRRDVAEMSDIGKDMFRKGVGEALVAQARATGDLNAMRRILRSDELADRLKVAFPDEQAFTRFINTVESEAQIAARDSRILNGSPTAYRQQLANRYNAPDAERGVGSLSNVSLAGIPAEAARLTARQIARMADKNRSVFQNEATNEVLGRALNDPRELMRLLMLRPRRPGLFGGYAPAGAAGAIPVAGYSTGN